MTVLMVSIFLVFIIGAALKAFSGNGVSNAEKASKNGVKSSKKVRLTNQQIVALSSAGFENPIYGENPSLLHAQMPNGAQAFNQRTIDSLVKRGYLTSDGRGGYLLTVEGADGLRIGMGF